MTEKCHHKPGPYKPFVSVRNKYETALEKAIINKGFSSVGDELIYWLDGELPIEPKQRNYKRLDLLGKDASGKYVLCELKFSGTGKGNKGPAAADNQLIEYKNLIQAYGERFGLHSNRPHDVQFNLNDFLHHKPRLMVVADATYWDRWKGINARRVKKRKLNEEVEHYSIDISTDDLEQQKLNAGKDNKYKPELPERAINWKFVKCEDY